MTASLIAAIVVLALAVCGLGYVWLVRPRRSTHYLAYLAAGRAAARHYRGDSRSQRGHEWR